MLSLLGIFQTALIVGVLSETLVIPPDEKRILASVEKQRKFPISNNDFIQLENIQYKNKVLIKFDVMLPQSLFKLHGDVFNSIRQVSRMQIIMAIVLHK